MRRKSTRCATRTRLCYASGSKSSKTRVESWARLSESRSRCFSLQVQALRRRLIVSIIVITRVTTITWCTTKSGRTLPLRPAVQP